MTRARLFFCVRSGLAGPAARGTETQLGYAVGKTCWLRNSRPIPSLVRDRGAFIRSAPMSNDPKPTTAEKEARKRVRREEATRRERERMHVLNEAFEHLQRALPFVPEDARMPKMTIIEAAIGYIHDLMDMLEEADRVEQREGAVGNGGGAMLRCPCPCHEYCSNFM